MDVSGFPSPAALVIFGNKHPSALSSARSELLDKMDQEFSKETAIVGHFNSCFEYRSANKARTRTPEAVALVFSRDRNASAEIGQTRFHVPCMRCVSQIGPTFSVVSVHKIDKDQGVKTYLLAKCLENGKILNGKSVNLALGKDERVFIDDLYIGFEKKASASNVIEKDKASSSSSSSTTFLSLHGVVWDWRSRGRGCLIVMGEGINPGDTFQFYQSDFERGLSMEGIPPQGIIDNKSTQVFGALVMANLSKIVANIKRSEITYCLPFYNLFENMPIGGLFSKTLIKRGNVTYAWKDGRYLKVGECETSHKGTTFLVMSFIPPS